MNRFRASLRLGWSEWLRLTMVVFMITLAVLADSVVVAQQVHAAPSPVGHQNSSPIFTRPIVEPQRSSFVPSTLTSAPYADGREAVFAVGSDNVVYSLHQVSGSASKGWSAQAAISAPAPAVLSGTLAVAQDASKQLVLVALGNDGHLYTIRQTGSSEQWSGWQTINSGATTFQSSPVVAQGQDGRLVVVALGNDGQVYQTEACATGCTWGGFAPVAQQQSPAHTGTPTIGALHDGSLVVVASGTDHVLYYTRLNGSQWDSLITPTGVTVQGAPAVVAATTTQAAQLFVVGSDQAIYSASEQSSGSLWSTLSKLGTLPQSVATGSSVQVIRGTSGSIALFVSTAQGVVATADVNSAGQLGSWTQLSRANNGFQGQPALTLARNGQPEIFVLDRQGRIQSTFEHALGVHGLHAMVQAAGTTSVKQGYAGFVPLVALTTWESDGLGDTSFYDYDTVRINDHVQLKVNVGSGDLLVEANELHIRGTGLDLAVQGTYNNQRNAWSPYGQNWSLNLGYSVTIFGNDDGSETFFDATGHPWTFTSDGSGNWISPPGIDADLTFNDSTGQETITYHKTNLAYTFTASHTILQQLTDKNGNTITFTVDSTNNEQIDAITDTQGRTTTLSYDPSGSGMLTQITDPTNRTVQYSYDGNQNLSSITDTNGKVTQFGYDTNNNLTSVTDPLNHVTNIAYNGNNQVATISDATPNHAQTSFAYYSSGSSPCTSVGNGTLACSTVTDANNHTTTYAYDSGFKVAAVKDANGNQTKQTYTPNFNVAQYTDQLTDQSVFSYSTDGRNNLNSVTDGSGASTQFGYPSQGDPLQYYPTSITDPQQNQTSIGYDSKGNATSVHDNTSGGTGITVNYTYNSNGTVATEKDGKNNQTSFSYDSKGNLTKVTFPSPLPAQILTVDSLSRVSSLTDGNNHKTTFTYDTLDRVTKITYADNSTVSYGYDDNGNVTSVTDRTGTTSFQYDNDNRQTKKTVPGGSQVTTSFDLIGNLTSLTTPGGTTSYAYNAVNLVNTLTEPGNAQTHFSYDNAYRRTATNYPNGSSMTMTYDNGGHVLTAVGKHGSTTLTSYTYTYKNGSNNTSLRQTVKDVANNTTSYSYDSQNRLTTALVKNQGGTQTDKYAYQYDAASNLTQIQHGLSNPTTTNLSYNGANELTSSTGVSSYSYDGNGNLTGWSGGPSISYNDQNQTTAIGSTTFGYAGPDQNERVQVNSTNNLYTGLGLSSVGSTTYIRDNRGQLIDERTSSGTYYYLFDGLGSIVGLTDSSGNLVNNETYQYDPYGNLTHAPSSSVLQQNPWRYASGYFDSGTGMYKFGIRYYMPTVGRWTQRDPVGGSLAETTSANPYVYADDTPVNKVDPGGRFAFLAAFVLVAISTVAGALGNAASSYIANPHESAHDIGQSFFAGAIEGFLVGVGGLFLLNPIALTVENVGAFGVIPFLGALGLGLGDRLYNSLFGS